MSKFSEDKCMNRSAYVAPTNLKQVSLMIAQGQCLSQPHRIFPGRGLVAGQQICLDHSSSSGAICSRDACDPQPMSHRQDAIHEVVQVFHGCK